MLVVLLVGILFGGLLVELDKMVLILVLESEFFSASTGEAGRSVSASFSISWNVLDEDLLKNS